MKPSSHLGLRHVAFYIKNFEACANFYVNLLGFKIVWQPDPDNLYLSSGSDNLALHRAPDHFSPGEHQHLDHIGLFTKTAEDVDSWHTYLKAANVTIKAAPRDHRDKTRSFYCADPDGNIIQFIHVPAP